MSAAQYEVHGDVAVIKMHNPPVNGLGYELRRGLLDGIRQAEKDSAVKALVLIGADGVFSGGADIREFNTPKMLAEPSLHTVINYLDTTSKPVIAAINGVCMGGGLELALACHYRVADPKTQVALPEVKLGLLPGAGGTQRLPRLIGAESALNMIVSGVTLPAKQFKGSPLFDAYAEGNLLEEALAFARRVIEEKRPIRRVRDLSVTHPKPEAYFLFARQSVAAVSKPYPAPLKCLEAVEAAVMKPFDEGLKVERAGFLHLIQTDESKALRHAFFAERAASKIPDVPADTPTREIKKVGVIGGGTMGSGITINFLNAGIPVTLLEMNEQALERGIGNVRRVYEDRAKRGKMKPEEVEQRMALLQPTLSYDDLRDVDLVIEAVFEDINAKEQVFRKLDEVCKPGAILASNTSTLDLNKIAGFTKRPQDVIGLHFFSPAHVMRLLEVVRGAQTAKDVLATAMKLAKTIKKTAVVAGVCDGFIGNRMIARYSREAMLMLEEGASPQQVDRAIEAFGFAMGPFRMSDLAGNDVSWFIRKRHYEEHPEMKRLPIADRICELGRFGQKTGAGYYRYEPGRRDPIPDPEVDKIIEEVRRELGITPRKFTAQEIVDRCVLALVNEGAKILEEGIALRASDIDLIYLTGYGFPVYRGGPMFYADLCGLLNVVRTMEKIRERGHPEPQFWEPAPLLARLAEEGKKFNESE